MVAHRCWTIGIDFDSLSLFVSLNHPLPRFHSLLLIYCRLVSMSVYVTTAMAKNIWYWVQCANYHVCSCMCAACSAVQPEYVSMCVEFVNKIGFYSKRNASPKCNAANKRIRLNPAWMNDWTNMLFFSNVLRSIHFYAIAVATGIDAKRWMYHLVNDYYWKYALQSSKS